MRDLAVSKPFCGLVVLVGAFLLFVDLGDEYLWQDEAETALLARNLLEHGYPVAWDGKNLITQNAGLDSNESHMWTWHPWLPFYLAAASFAVLGESTVAARLPFALVGLACLPLLYLVTRRLTRNEVVARIATVLLVTSVPFLLHARQARWYAPAVLATLWVLHAYLGLLRRERTAALQLVLATQVLFHTSYLTFLATGAGLFLHLIYCARSGRQRPALRAVAAVAGATLALAVPWVVLIEGWKRANVFEQYDLPFVARTMRILGTLLVYTNGYVFPLLLAPVVAWILLRRREASGDAPRSGVLLLVLLVVATFGVLVIQPWTYFRYMVGLLPVFAVLLALVVWEVWRRSYATGLLVLALLVTTNVASALLPPVGLRSDLASFLYELTHDYRGPNEAIVDYLREHGTEDEVVVAGYGDLPIMFYTNMRVLGFSQDLARVERPDWIVPRQGRKTRDWLLHLGRGYRRIELDAVDLPWGNRPDPAYHKFRTVRQGPPVLLLRRPEGVKS